MIIIIIFKQTKLINGERRTDLDIIKKNRPIKFGPYNTPIITTVWICQYNETT